MNFYVYISEKHFNSAGKKAEKGMQDMRMNTIHEMEQPSEVHTVWIGEADRIASFHAVDAYELQTFVCHDLFIKYLRTLQERGFRFQ